MLLIEFIRRVRGGDRGGGVGGDVYAISCEKGQFVSDTQLNSRVGQGQRNFVSPYTRWEQLRQRARNLSLLLLLVAIPGTLALAAAWWWIAS